jgi:hypothetical protein
VRAPPGCDDVAVPGLIRFQSAVPSRSGRFPGVFALANALARQGRLSAADLAWWHAANARLTAAYVDPTTVVPGCYDPEVNPGARAWFRLPSSTPLDMTREYLGLLDRYGVAWTELRTTTPGRITYEDAVQVVAVPFTYDADWWLHDGSPWSWGPPAPGPPLARRPGDGDLVPLVLEQPDDAHRRRRDAQLAPRPGLRAHGPAEGRADGDGVRHDDDGPVGPRGEQPVQRRPDADADVGDRLAPVGPDVGAGVPGLELPGPPLLDLLGGQALPGAEVGLLEGGVDPRGQAQVLADDAGGLLRADHRGGDELGGVRDVAPEVVPDAADELPGGGGLRAAPLGERRAGLGGAGVAAGHGHLGLAVPHEDDGDGLRVVEPHGRAGRAGSARGRRRGAGLGLQRGGGAAGARPVGGHQYASSPRTRIRPESSQYTISSSGVALIFASSVAGTGMPLPSDRPCRRAATATPPNRARSLS